MNRVALLLLACVTGSLVHAQDAAPFFAGRTPLLLDPSRTGFESGGRISFLHQDQWLQVPGAWRNEQLAGEWCLRNDKKEVNSWFGMGLRVGSEQLGANSGRLSNVGVLTAVHLRAGPKSYLSSGLELRWANGRLGDGSGAWGSQYDGMRYDAAMASGETWSTSNQTWAEARAGISFTVKAEEESPRRRERDLLVVGVSADHLGHLVLKESGTSTAVAPMRFTVYGLGELPLGRWENGFVAADLIGHVQGPFQTGRLNLYVGRHLYNRVRSPGGPMLLGFKAGVGYQWHGAILANAAVDLGSLTIGTAYGWSLFNGDKMASGRQTFELMLQLRMAKRMQ